MELLDGVNPQKEKTRLVLNNILFATDFSPSSEMALKYALALARHYHAKIHIIQAVALDSVEAIASDARLRALDEERSFAISCAKKLRVSGKLEGVRHQVLVQAPDASSQSCGLGQRAANCAHSQSPCEGEVSLGLGVVASGVQALRRNLETERRQCPSTVLNENETISCILSSFLR